LTLLDRQRGGMIVATTNRADVIDPALLRRFDDRILFPEPNVGQKRALAETLAAKFGVEPIPVDDCANFDEVTKRVETEARRVVMRELLAADSAPDDSTDDDQTQP
jgi:ATP-dependent 26S proteasome regulatory subunit